MFLIKSEVNLGNKSVFSNGETSGNDIDSSDTLSTCSSSKLKLINLISTKQVISYHKLFNKKNANCTERLKGRRKANNAYFWSTV